MKKTLSVFFAFLITALSILSLSVPTFAAETDDFMQVRQAALAAEVKSGNIPKDAFWDQGEDGSNKNVRLVKSRVKISDASMFKVTRKTASQNADNSEIRVATIYTDRKTSVNAEAYMYYLEIPEEVEDPTVQFSWNIYENDNGKQESGHPYSGTCYYLLEGTKTWVQTAISNLWFSLPTGFKGYVLFKPADFKDVGLRFNKNWQLQTTHLYIPNLNNSTILISAPFIVENIGNMGFAAYVNGDTSTLKNLFTGETVAPENAVYKMQAGDTVYSLPEATAEFNASAPDLTYLPTSVEIVWDAVDGVSSYSAKLFKMNVGAGNKSYLFEKELIVDTTAVTFEALQENQRYSIVIYGLDSEGREVAVSDAVTILASRGINFDKSPSKGLNTTVVIIIAAAAVVVAAVVLIVVFALKKKK